MFLPGCAMKRNNPAKVWVSGSVLQESLLSLLLMYTPYVEEDKCVHSHYARSCYLRPKEPQTQSWLPQFQDLDQDKCGLCRCLVGAAIHGGEKCVELLLSLEILDLGACSRIGNSPISMACEGDYSPERAFIIEALMRAGSKVDGQCKAGYGCSDSMLFFICKPHRLPGTNSILGKPVHPDDKELVKKFIGNGVGAEFFDAFDMKLRAEAQKESPKEIVCLGRNGSDGLAEIPSQIASFSSSLMRIDLSGNCITVLPDAFFALKRLTHVNLSRNLLYEVSPRFAHFTDLEELNVAENLVESLPVSLIQCEKLKSLTCFKNPIIQPPMEVVGPDHIRGPCDVMRVMGFFKAIVESGSVENQHLKVMVLGRSEVGKTSLINAMVEKVSRLTRVGDRTVGIEQRQWTIPLENGRKPLNLKVLDFAGQDEYYITHHLYLTARALYIIAFDLSTYEDADFDRVLLFFLRSLQMRVPHARLLIVGTHADQLHRVKDVEQKCKQVETRLKEWEYEEVEFFKDRLVALDMQIGLLQAALKSREQEEVCREEEGNSVNSEKNAEIVKLKEEHAKLKKALSQRIKIPERIYAVSSTRSLHGISSFRAAVEAAAQDKESFPQVGEQIPIFFDDMRNWVRGKRDFMPFCSETDFVEALEKDLPGHDINVVKSAILFLHDLGELLAFPEHGLVVLSLAWLIDVMKCIVRHDHFEALQWNSCSTSGMSLSAFKSAKEAFLSKGVLSLDLLKALWLPLELDCIEFRKILQIVEKFEIITRLENHVETHVQGENGPRVGENKTSKFLVPLFLPKLIASKYLRKHWPDVCPNHYMQLSAQLTSSRFRQTLPAGFLQRLQALLHPLVTECKGWCYFAQEGALLSMNLIDGRVYVLLKLVERSEDMASTHRDQKGACSFSSMTRVDIGIRGESSNANEIVLESLLSLVRDKLLPQWPGLMVDTALE